MKKYQKKYQFLRPIIIWLYNFRCQLCKSSPEQFDVHHVNHKATDNNPFNLVPLCKPCHIKAHSGKIKLDFKPPCWIVSDLERVKAFVDSSYK